MGFIILALIGCLIVWAISVMGEETKTRPVETTAEPLPKGTDVQETENLEVGDLVVLPERRSYAYTYAEGYGEEYLIHPKKIRRVEERSRDALGIVWFRLGTKWVSLDVLKMSYVKIALDTCPHCQGNPTALRREVKQIRRDKHGRAFQDGTRILYCPKCDEYGVFPKLFPIGKHFFPTNINWCDSEETIIRLTDLEIQALEVK